MQTIYTLAEQIAAATGMTLAEAFETDIDRDEHALIPPTIYTLAAQYQSIGLTHAQAMETAGVAEEHGLLPTSDLSTAELTELATKIGYPIH